MDENIGRLIFFGGVILAGDYAVAREMYSIAQLKGYSSIKYFLFPFFLTLPGWLIVLALPDRNLQRSRKEDEQSRD